MENLKTLSQIRAALINEARVLRELSDRAYNIESRIKRIINSLNTLENGDSAPVNEKKTNIIPFPVAARTNAGNMKAVSVGNFTEKNGLPRPFLNDYMRRHPFLVPILARPGKSMPVEIPDFREVLQRDGLILLSWDKRITENGELYTAYWVTSCGICRYFASAALELNEFLDARPIHKSYAAEDGIEFYGQPRPHYIVHVAPELMMNHKGQIDERPKHIEKLKSLGIKSDFDYKYLLTREKKKFPGRRRSNRDWEKTGA